MKMVKVKNKARDINLEKNGSNKNKVNILGRNLISKKAYQKIQFHRSLEAFSDCV
jgi:hypothetical protein|tara:strand:+ start:150 stop:314 length:165 start_codon:yes stop_codon:yes gene_type:complete